MTLGPVQLIVIVVESGHCKEDVLVELRRLGDGRSVKLIDFLFVGKEEDGDVVVLDRGGDEIGRPAGAGRLVARLIGGVAGAVEADLGPTDRSASAPTNGHSGVRPDVWYLADAIPPGSSAVVALIEHRWAIPLRDAVDVAAGHALVDHWVHPEDLIAIGADPG